MNQGNVQDFSQYQQQYEKAKQNSSMFLQKVFASIKSILRSPATEGAKFAASEDTSIALGLLAFQAIFSALFALVVTSKINSLLNLLYSFDDMDLATANLYKLPFFKIFIVTIIVSMLLSCILAGLLLVISMFMKNNVTYKTMLCVAATRSVALIPVIIISIVLFYINNGAGLMVFYLGSLAGLCYMVSAFPAASADIKNRIPAIVFIASLIFTVVSVFIMYQCIPYYLPEGMKEGWSYMKEGLRNPSEVFEKIFGSLY
jgi:hypothetical protein